MQSQVATERTRSAAGWPLYVLFLGYPLWWALGLNAFLWTIVGAVTLGVLALRKGLRAPRGFWIWGLFLAWVLLSSTQLDSQERWMAFGYRASAYLSATILFLYIFNTSKDRLPTGRILTILGVFWMMVVIGGYLGMMFPGVGWHSPMERFLPDRLLDNELVRQLFRPGFADASEFLGFYQPRPAAPFTWANEWGANLAILTPIVIATWATKRSRVWNGLTKLLLIAAVVPMIGSLNRGLWLSLGVGIVYGAVRLAFGGSVRALASTLALVAVASALIYFTPLGSVGAQRIATPHSNDTRSALYEEATERALERPLTGWGGPRASLKNPNLPSVGTHGQLWLVLVSQGLPGAALFVGWYVFVLMRSRRGVPGYGIWLHVVLVVACIQLPFYEHLPVHIQTTMVVSAVILRELVGRRSVLAGTTVEQRLERRAPAPVTV